MKEIKFRAWNKELNKWHIWHNFKHTKDEDADDFVMKIGNNDNDLIYLQYTGLKDKNGKEIYESDLIKQQDYKEPLEVYFCKDCAGFRAKLNGYGNTEFIKDDCEIIGNIFENLQNNSEGDII